MDCIRDVLSAAEHIPLDHVFLFKDICSDLKKYNKDEIQYSCMKLFEAGMIVASTVDADNLPLYKIHSIIDITYKGHQFLAKIRDEDRWRGIKKVLPVIRDYSIDAINAVANGFASAAITSYFTKIQP